MMYSKFLKAEEKKDCYGRQFILLESEKDMDMDQAYDVEILDKDRVVCLRRLTASKKRAGEFVRLVVDHEVATVHIREILEDMLP